MKAQQKVIIPHIPAGMHLSEKLVRLEIAPGFSILAASESSASDVRIESQTPEMPAFELQLFYLISEGAVAPTSHIPRRTITTDWNDCNSFFITGSGRHSFCAGPLPRVSYLLLTITGEWLEKEFQVSKESLAQLTNHFRSTTPIPGHSLPGEFLTASKIFSHVITNNNNDLFLRSRILLLLSDFMERTYQGRPRPGSKVPVIYYQKIAKAENIINASMQCKLPPIGTIASQAKMSESGLKRYFQKVFGMNIYEYYLSAKMDTAKRLLVEKKFSVSEVSEYLGYENTRHFVTIFKKHFSVPPDAILKSKSHFFTD